MRLRPIIKRWLYGSVPGFAGSFPYFGTRVYFPRHSMIFHRACEEGIFEARVLGMIRTLVEPGTTYLDVGANIGLMSVPVLATVPDAQVWSFEPSPSSLACLQRTAAGSSFGSRWRIVPRAARQQIGPVEFFASSAAGGALDGLKDSGRGIELRTVKVESTTLDEVWLAEGRPRISCIKIDVEGAELEVLMGGQKCIVANRPSIVLEWNSTNLAAYDRSPGTLLEYAAEHGFEVVSCEHFTPIGTQAMLRLAMRGCENFLLLPR